MEAKAYRGQIILELSLFILVIVGLVSLTATQTQKLKEDMKNNRIGQSYEKVKNR